MQMFERPDEWTTVRLYAGDFAVLYLGETHAPGVAYGEPGTVRKMVLKVPAVL